MGGKSRSTTGGDKVDNDSGSRPAGASAEKAHETGRAVIGTGGIDWKLLVSGIALAVLGITAFVVASLSEEGSKAATTAWSEH